MSSKPISRPPPPPPPPSSAACQPPPQEWSVRACSIFGIPVFLHFSLPLFLGFLCLTHARLGAIGIIFAVCYAAVLFLTVTVHEFGHCLAAQKVGCRAERVLLWPLGGLATCVMPTNPRDRIIVAAAGPATHLPMTLCWLILSATTGYPIRFWSPAVPLEASSLYHWLCWVGLYINVLLFVFNLLVPVFPLDGSQLLLNFLLLRGATPARAARIIILVSVPMAVLLAGWALVNGNSLGCFLVLWLCMQTWRLHQAAAAGRLETHPLFVDVAPRGGPGMSGQAQAV